MTNLLTNSAKFYLQNTNVTITCFDLEDNLEIKVNDWGISISKINLNQIFDWFTQADSTNSRAICGTELGLTITKLLVNEWTGQSALNQK
jgi:signal transduction histidine kinase